MELKQKQYKIKIVNLEKENKELKEKQEKIKKAYQEVSYMICSAFGEQIKELKREIKSLKLEWANKEADLILKKIEEKIK